MLVCYSFHKKLSSLPDLPLEDTFIGDLALDEYIVDADGNYLIGF